jgi:hypothetical protein
MYLLYWVHTFRHTQQSQAIPGSTSPRPAKGRGFRRRVDSASQSVTLRSGILNRNFNNFCLFKDYVNGTGN